MEITEEKIHHIGDEQSNVHLGYLGQQHMDNMEGGKGGGGDS